MKVWGLGWSKDVLKAEINATPCASATGFPPPTMAPVTALSSHERTRVEDYLNDKIQVSADLESLDSLLSSLRAQQELQRKQVSPPAVLALSHSPY